MRIPRSLRFAAVGVGNTILDLALFTGLVSMTELAPVTANVVSYGVCIVASFLVNRVVTFGDLGNRMGTGAQLAAFVLIQLGSLGITSAVVHFGAPLVGPLAAKVASVPFGFAWNYLLTRRVLYA